MASMRPMILLLSIALGVAGYQREYAVVWQESLWVIDGVRTPQLFLAVGESYRFNVSAPAPHPFLLYALEEENETSATRIPLTDGITGENPCVAPCAVVFAPHEAIQLETVFYGAVDAPNTAGNALKVSVCNELPSNVSCIAAGRCGWVAASSACTLCSAVMSDTQCDSADPCVWCSADSMCIATDDPCDEPDGSGGSVPGWVWVAVVIAGFVLVAAAFAGALLLFRRAKVVAYRRRMMLDDDADEMDENSETTVSLGPNAERSTKGPAIREQVITI